MESKPKNLLLSTSLILFMSCSTAIDKSKIVGSWYFVDYADKPYSKMELEKFETKKNHLQVYHYHRLNLVK